MIASRRGFLRTLAGAFAAPAIVRADSLMKIFVPPKITVLESRWTLYGELTTITRAGFTPKVMSQFYYDTPLLLKLMEQAR